MSGEELEVNGIESNSTSVEQVEPSVEARLKAIALKLAELDKKLLDISPKVIADSGNAGLREAVIHMLAATMELRDEQICDTQRSEVEDIT